MPSGIRVSRVHAREKMCSCIRVSWMFASGESVTMRQLTMPSAMVLDTAWRRRLCIWIPVAFWEYDSSSGSSSNASASAAWRRTLGGAGGARVTSAAHRLICLSRPEAAFYTTAKQLLTLLSPSQYGGEAHLDREIIDRIPSQLAHSQMGTVLTSTCRSMQCAPCGAYTESYIREAADAEGGPAPPGCICYGIR